MPNHKNCTIFQLDWNKEGYLAIASQDQNIYVKKLDPEIKTFDHIVTVKAKCASRCISWSPRN